MGVINWSIDFHRKGSSTHFHAIIIKEVDAPNESDLAWLLKALNYDGTLELGQVRPGFAKEDDIKHVR